jgi:DNA polymerase (family 10)
VIYSNAQVAELLTNVATAYEILGKNRFEIGAYKNASDTIISYPEEIYDLWTKDPKLLDALPHIGPAIFTKITYLFEKNKLHPHLKESFKSIHPAVFTFTKVNGIGPLIAYKLVQNFKFSRDPLKSLEQLIKNCQQGKIRDLPSFGEKSEKSILDNTLSFIGHKNRLPLKTALELSDKIITYLSVHFPQTNFIALGSLRRLSPTVGDIDIATASTCPQPILDYFQKYPDAIQTISSGSHKASLRLPHDVRVDLMIKPPESFGALLQHFTGSRQHNIILRKHALKLGFSLSEYGIKNLKTKKIIKFSNEKEFYNFLGLQWIPPTVRAGESELDKYKMV